MTEPGTPWKVALNHKNEPIIHREGSQVADAIFLDYAQAVEFMRAANEYPKLQAQLAERQAEIERLRGYCVRSLSVIADAIMHGMPITKEIADLRNCLVRQKAAALKENSDA